jgi:hypothetical protein
MMHLENTAFFDIRICDYLLEENPIYDVTLGVSYNLGKNVGHLWDDTLISFYVRSAAVRK